MIKAITDFFEKHLLLPADEAGTDNSHTLRLATAALLIEMTRADYEVKSVELETILSLLQDHFAISAVETRELLQLAEHEADMSTTYHKFTSLINSQYSAAQKIQVIELLWEVAFADGKIQKYEDYLVRKIADLLYVPHREFIAAKHRVLDRR
jgi:uncharacterized tellurite resistance protein B-like protein